LMEPGCKLEDFGRPAQPAVPNRLRCRAGWCLSDIYVKPLREVGASRFMVYAWLIVVACFSEELLLRISSFNVLGVCWVERLGRLLSFSQSPFPLRFFTVLSVEKSADTGRSSSGFCIEFLLGSK
jgi:hypothetical protein